MQDEPQTQAGAAAPNQPPKAPPAPAAQTVAEAKGTRAQWRERARATFGVSPHAVAGALHDVRAGEEVAESEVRRRLEEFSSAKGVEE